MDLNENEEDNNKTSMSEEKKEERMMRRRIQKERRKLREKYERTFVMINEFKKNLKSFRTKANSMNNWMIVKQVNEIY
jgi:hypothetical protein